MTFQDVLDAWCFWRRKSRPTRKSLHKPQQLSIVDLLENDRDSVRSDTEKFKTPRYATTPTAERGEMRRPWSVRDQENFVLPRESPPVPI